MNMRVPDIAVNCVPDERGQRALPDPILIIEILSPSNERETRENVWAYATIPSLREILLVRSTEIANWIAHQVLPGRATKGRG